MSGSVRQRARAQRTDRFWRARHAAARTNPEQAARLAWDHLRARVAKVPEHRRGPVWTWVARRLIRDGDDLAAVIHANQDGDAR
jgi:hypothetical protein